MKPGGQRKLNFADAPPGVLFAILQPVFRHNTAGARRSPLCFKKRPSRAIFVIRQTLFPPGQDGKPGLP